MRERNILIFTATNLSEDISIPELGFHNYSIYMKDRSSVTSNKLSEMGVLIAVDSDIPTAEMTSSIINIVHYL